MILIASASTSAILLHSKKAVQITKKSTSSSKKIVASKVTKAVTSTTKTTTPPSSPSATTTPSTTVTKKPATTVTSPETSTPPSSSPTSNNNASLSQTPYLSNIWTGYEIKGSDGEYTMAQGTIVVPTVTCSDNYTQFSLWVGLDGADSGNTIEQEGIRAMCETTPGGCNANCTSASPSYFIWTDRWPIRFSATNLTYIACDTLFMKVNYISASNEYDMYFDDETTGGTFNIDQACPSGSVCQNSTAEWISENHLAAGTLISLFGSASFTNAQVGTAQNASPTPFTDFTNYPLEAYVNGQQQESVTYPLNQGATSFTIQQLVND